MAHISDLIATDIDAYLKSHETKSLATLQIERNPVDRMNGPRLTAQEPTSHRIFLDQIAYFQHGAHEDSPGEATR